MKELSEPNSDNHMEKRNKVEGRNGDESQLRKKKASTEIKKRMGRELCDGDNREKKPSVEKKGTELCGRVEESTNLT